MGRNQRIKNALREAKVSQEQVAEELGVSQGAVGKQLNKDEDVDSIALVQAVSKLTGQPLTVLIDANIVAGIVKEDGAPYNTLKANYISLLEKENKRLESELDNAKSELKQLKQKLGTKDS